MQKKGSKIFPCPFVLESPKLYIFPNSVTNVRGNGRRMKRRRKELVGRLPVALPQQLERFFGASTQGSKRRKHLVGAFVTERNQPLGDAILKPGKNS